MFQPIIDLLNQLSGPVKILGTIALGTVAAVYTYIVGGRAMHAIQGGKWGKGGILILTIIVICAIPITIGVFLVLGNELGDSFLNNLK